MLFVSVSVPVRVSPVIISPVMSVDGVMVSPVIVVSVITGVTVSLSIKKKLYAAPAATSKRTINKMSVDFLFFLKRWVVPKIFTLMKNVPFSGS